MTTTAARFAADAVAPAARMGLGVFDQVIADIPAAKFARKPEGVDTNHPAWILGHLAIYPDMVLEMIGRPELADPDERLTKLFEQGAECQDDADGSIYPTKDALTARFTSRMNTALSALAEADDETLSKPNTAFASEHMPTVGALANFLVGHHVMLHAGQISAWRRAMGMGPCM